MSDLRLGLGELDAVIAVARRASFRQAAIDLDVSTTALSNTIAKVAASLETRLFNRTTRSVAVSKAVVQQGLGLGFFMEQDVHAEIDTGEFERVLENWTPPRDNLCLYYPNRRNPSAAFKAFIALVRASQDSKDRLG
jgi:DNA-binding transcriptional LysR family regulator